jgi:hypothetical protein
MANDELFVRFRRSFCGNEVCFTIHVPPFRKEEGKDKIAPAWCGFAQYGTKSFPDVPEGCAKGDFVPLTDEYYRKHLNGELGLAVTPVFTASGKKNICYHAAIDIDVNTNFTWFVSRLEHFRIPGIPTISKSNGLHVYFIFAHPEPAADVIRTLERIVEIFGIDRLFTSEKNKRKVEIFPKASVCVPGEKNANGLLLPFFDAAHKSKQNMLTAEGKLVGITKALPIIESMFTSVKELNSVLDDLPYSDAPYCIQMVLLTGALAENDGRNNFLCCVAIYFKKKFGSNSREVDFLDELREANNCLESPLEDGDIQRIYKSMTEGGYDKYWCAKPPCQDYCDKSLCRLREFGIGKAKNNISTGADSWGELSRVTAGKPYYIWKVRVNPEDEYKEVYFDGEDDVLNQAIVQRRCMRDLNWVPTTVKKQVWDSIVNASMKGIDEREIEVSKETDTTEMGTLRDLFVRYLAHKQIQNGQPYMVKLGQVYHTDGAYYFSTKGIMDFLRFEKFSLLKINLREQLKEYGCSDGELTYKTAKGEEKVIKCWTKPDDAELLEMDAFYEDVYDGDAALLQKDTCNKEEKEGGSDGVKF